MTLPYGTWPSPISAERIAAGARPLAAPCIAGTDIYWLEGRAAEQGRMALCRARPDGTTALQTPMPFNLRSKVHEYGGGACAADGDTIAFVHFDDQRVYLQQGGAAPQPITPASPRRHADLQFDRRRARLIAVQEDHAAAPEPRQSLVALPLGPADDPLELMAGHDFYSSPRLSPDGTRLAWLAWNHPDMPWDGTELWCAAVTDDGCLREARQVAGGRGEALCQPRWAADGTLFVVSDRSGWWNLHRVDDGDLKPVCAMDAECGEPMWVFGQSMWDFCGEHHALVAAIAEGIARLFRVDLLDGRAERIALPFEEIHDLHCGDGFAVMLAGAPDRPLQLLRLDLGTLQWRTIARSLEEMPDAEGLWSRPQPLHYASGPDGRHAHAWFFPPAGGNAPAGEKPPLLVMSHGGPTAMSPSTLRMAVQFWTSRGFAVLDVNYGGSTGYGREYRRLLDGQWGVVDVEDCVAGARALAERGLVDPHRMAIRGGSASGFTTLSALIFHDVFKAGAVLYGVADLAALDADTHKFESRYTQRLICAPQDRERVYAQRSPIHHVARLRCPVIFFQGLEDRVVPPAQSRTMVQALRNRGVPVAYLEWEGEGHGFRRPETQRRTLEAELSFYGQVFGFRPAGDIEPIAIQGL